MNQINYAQKIILFSLIFLVFSCSKDQLDDPILDQDYLSESFTQSDNCFYNNNCLIEANTNLIDNIRNVDARSKTFISSLKSYISNAKQSGLADHIIENYGIPYWNGRTVLPPEKDGTQIALIPIIGMNSSYVEHIMVVKLDKSNNSPSFNFIERSEIDSYNEQEDGISYKESLLTFISLDTKVFGTTNTKFSERYEQLVGNNKNIICYAVLNQVITEWYQYDPITDTWTQLSNTYSYQWGDLCIDIGFDPTDNPPDIPNNTGGTNPNPPDETSSSEYIISDESNDPCIGALIAKLKDSNFGTNGLSQLLRDIFDESADVNITIKVDDLPTGTDGITTNVTYRGTPGIGFYFDAEVILNSDYTGGATQDWLLATILHEMIHGYIDFYRGQLESGFITQDEFDRKFPMFNSDETGHLTMGFQYVNAIADVLQQNNPNLSREEALALSRVGLDETGFWAFTLSSADKNAAITANNIGRGDASSTTTTQIPC